MKWLDTYSGTEHFTDHYGHRLTMQALIDKRRCYAAVVQFTAHTTPAISSENCVRRILLVHKASVENVIYLCPSVSGRHLLW